MKKKLTNNIGLKILALVVAFVLWLMVVNYDDPVVHNTYSGIPVEIINQDSLTEQGKVYEVLNNTDTISVTVYGTRSVLESISKEDIRAVADMEDLTLMDTISIEVTTNKNFSQIENIKSDTEAVELQIEDLKEIHLPINVVEDGTPADGYIVGDITTNQNTIRISGAESVVSDISYAQAVVDVDGRNSDVSTNVDIKLYDKSGNLIEGADLTQNIRTLNVSVSILATKTVNVDYHMSGTPEDGYIADEELTSDRPTLLIAGKQSVLDTVNAIEVPASAINVEGKNESFTVAIDLSKYLPDGTRLAEESDDGLATVTVNILKTVIRTLNVPMSNITLTNVPAGENAQLLIQQEDVAVSEDGQSSSSEILIKVSTVGVLESYDGVNGSSITGTVDIQAYMDSIDQDTLLPGTYQMEIQLNLPEGITTTDTYYASVQIKSPSDEDTTEE